MERIRLYFVLILIFVYLSMQNSFVENFGGYYQTFQSFIPINRYGYTNFPWWNTQIGNTKNMSYDLRGDPIVIPKNNFVWMNSTIIPIYNKSI